MLLDNLKHELFAKSLIAYKGNQTKAYLEVYKSCSSQSARSKASRLVAKGNILPRTYELLAGYPNVIYYTLKVISQGLDAEKITKCGGKIYYCPDHIARMAWADLCLKMFDWIER